MSNLIHQGFTLQHCLHPPGAKQQTCDMRRWKKVSSSSVLQSTYIKKTTRLLFMYVLLALLKFSQKQKTVQSNDKFSVPRARPRRVSTHGHRLRLTTLHTRKAPKSPTRDHEFPRSISINPPPGEHYPTWARFHIPDFSLISGDKASTRSRRPVTRVTCHGNQDSLRLVLARAVACRA